MVAGAVKTLFGQACHRMNTIDLIPVKPMGEDEESMSERCIGQGSSHCTGNSRADASLRNGEAILRCRHPSA
jgi:hypothetical protein